MQFRLSGERIHLDVDSLNEQLKVQGPDRLRCEPGTGPGGCMQQPECGVRSASCFLGSVQPALLWLCRHSMRPDEAFGLIFQFDNVVSGSRIISACLPACLQPRCTAEKLRHQAWQRRPYASTAAIAQVANTRELQRAAWKAVAEAEGLPFPTMERPQLYDMRPERAAMDVRVVCCAASSCGAGRSTVSCGRSQHSQKQSCSAGLFGGCCPHADWMARADVCMAWGMQCLTQLAWLVAPANNRQPTQAPALLHRF